MRKDGAIRLLFSMEKVKVIALKSFEYGGVIRTPQSPPFDVDRLDFKYFESNKMVKIYIEEPQTKPKKGLKNVDDNA